MIYISNLIAGLENGLDNNTLLLNSVNPFGGDVGIELFLHTGSSDYMQKLSQIPQWFAGIPVTAHGPFRDVEATAPPNSTQQKHLLDSYSLACSAAAKLGSKHLVFHSNECYVSIVNKTQLQKNCITNLEKIIEIAKRYNIRILIENLGIPCKGLPLFDANEYINIFKRFNSADCLIDIGHLYLANWDIQKVISSLSNRIVGYHLHNNDGVRDSHRTLNDGVINFNEFFKQYLIYTPKAHITLEYGDDCDADCSDLISDIKYVTIATSAII